jgi:hypothetical protein
MLVSSVPQIHTKWDTLAPKAAAVSSAESDAAVRLVEVEPDHLVAVGAEESA